MKHRKEIKHYHEPGDLHEFTFSCYQRWALLTSDDRRRILSQAIDRAGDAEQFDLVAFVYMPEHVHLLVWPKPAKPALSRYLGRLKQDCSSKIRQMLESVDSHLVERLTIEQRPGKWCFQFWQAGPGFDRNLFSQQALESAINYIHNNPVRRGLCERAVDWPWSSARYYLLEPPRQQFEGLPFVHGPPAGIFS